MNRLVLTIILCAGIGGILYGYDIGVISGALLFIRRTIPMTDDQMGIIVGAVLAGGLLGTLITGYLSDRFGRRSMIIVACLVFYIGISLILLANSYVALLLSRLTLGVGVGIVAVTVPLYLAEIVPAAIRGKSVTVFQIFLTLGILLAYFIDYLFTPSGNWHAMFAVLLIPTTILFFGILYLPESPRYLFSRNRNYQARHIISRTHPKQQIEHEVTFIKRSLQKQNGSWHELFSMKWALPLFIAVFIAASNQLTGINVIFQYAPIVLQKTGFSSHSGEMLATVSLGLVSFITTIIALLGIDYFGRRTLLILGTSGLVVVDILLALLTHFGHPHQIGLLFTSLAMMLFYVFFYAIGPGVVVWLAISELLPTKIRGKAVALGLFVNSFCAALLSSTYIPLQNHIGLAGCYLVFAGFTFLYLLVAVFLLPETKKKSLEEIQQYFTDKRRSFIPSPIKAEQT